MTNTKVARKSTYNRPEEVIEIDNEVEAAPIASKPRGLRDAALRAEQIRDRMRNNEQNLDHYDEFFIDPRVVPEGWDYNWKRLEIAGMKDPAYEVELLQAGWEPVDAGRHPDMVPPGYKGAITKKGMILMERPSEISNIAKQRELSTAREAVAAKERALGLAPSGQFERDQSKTGVRKSYSPMSVPTN